MNKILSFVQWLSQTQCFRVITFITCVIFSSLIFLFPLKFAHTITGQNQLMLAILMMGISIGFIYSFGYQAKTTLWKMLFHPLCAWILITIGIFYFIN